MLQGTIETNHMKQITRDELELLLNPKAALLDEQFMLLNWVADEDQTSDPISFIRGIIA